jgi:hypothetical protein
MRRADLLALQTNSEDLTGAEVRALCNEQLSISSAMHNGDRLVSTRRERVSGGRRRAGCQRIMLERHPSRDAVVRRPEQGVGKGLRADLEDPER